MASNSQKRRHASDDDNETLPEKFKGTSIKLALGDLYQETVQLRSDVKELKVDVHNVLKNQGQLSQDLKNIAEILKKSSEKLSSEKPHAVNMPDLKPIVPDELTSDTSEDPKSNHLDDDDDDDSVDDLDYVGRMLQEQSSQTEPVTILPEDITKTNVELRADIKNVLQHQTTLAINMKSIVNLLNLKSPSNLPLLQQEPSLVASTSTPEPSVNYCDDVEEIDIDNDSSEPVPVQMFSKDNGADGPSQVEIVVTPPPQIPQLLPFPVSGVVRPVPKIIPGPYTGTFLVGGDSTLIRDITEYESILMQIFTKKAHETDTEKARVLLRHLFRMVIPPEILSTSNVTGKSRDAVTHRWIRVPKIDEALLLPIFNQTRFQFPEFTDWYTDDKSRTVQYLNNVCKTVRHSSYNAKLTSNAKGSYSM